MGAPEGLEAGLLLLSAAGLEGTGGADFFGDEGAFSFSFSFPFSLSFSLSFSFSFSFSFLVGEEDGSGFRAVEAKAGGLGWGAGVREK